MLSTHWRANSPIPVPQNGVGLQSLSYSQGVLVDTTPPTCTLIDGQRGQPDYDGSTTGVARLYLACTDLESGVPAVLWGLGTAPGLDDVQPFTATVPSTVTVPLPVDLASTVPASHKSIYRMVDAELAAAATLEDGVVYYGTVVATNGAGLSAVVSSDGQNHDATGPQVVFVHDVIDAAGDVDVQFGDTVASWGATFLVVDAESGVASITAQLIADTAGGEALLDTVIASPTDTRVFVPSVAGITSGVRVFTRMTVTNGVGQTTIADSDGWLPDVSAPVFTTGPTDGPVAGVDVDAHAIQGGLAACWEAQDADTHIDYYRIAAVAGLSGPTTLLVDWAHVPRSASAITGVSNGAAFVGGVTCATVGGFTINVGDSFRVAVEAVDPLGHATIAYSDGVTVDWTAPVVGTVSVGAGAAAGVHDDLQLNSGSLVVGWGAITEAETPLVSVEVSVGTVPLGDDLSPRVSTADPDTTGRAGSVATVSGLSLSDGQSCFVTVTATNAAGVEGSRFSRVVVDGSAPVFAEIPTFEFAPSYTLPLGFETQPTFPGSVSGASVDVPLTAFADAHSGIPTLDVTVYTSTSDPAVAAGVPSGSLLPAGWAAGTVLAGPTAVAGNTGALSAPVAGLAVADGAFVWVVVTATNGVGLTTTAASRAVQVSTAQLTPGVVLDGADPSSDASYQPSTASYSARWSAFVDPDGQEVTYRVAVGTSPGLADVVAWESVGSALEMDALQDVSVPPNTAVYATVEATAGFRTATASSNGMVLGAVAPTLTNVQFENHSPLAAVPIDATTGAHYLSSGPVVVSWAASDPQGLTDCTVDVHAAPQSSDAPLLTATVPAVAGLAQFATTQLEGQTLYSTVTCHNIRDRATTVEGSQWGIVETSPPVAGTVYSTSSVRADSGLLFSGSVSDASVAWTGFVDQESHLSGFVVCLGTPSAPCSEVNAAVPSDTVTYSATGLSLADGSDYVWQISATNGAGMQVQAVSEAFIVDVSSPSAAASSVTLTLGDTAEVFWQGFTDNGSGITSFSVSIGTGPGLADVAGPTTSSVLRRRRLQTTGFDTATLPVGQPLFATVTAVDAAGNSVSASSSAEVRDSTPPVPPTTRVREVVTTSPSTDVDIQASTSIAVEWDAFVDAESGESGGVHRCVLQLAK